MVDLIKNRIVNWFKYKIERLRYAKRYKEWWQEERDLMSEQIGKEYFTKLADYNTDCIINLKPKIILEYGCGYGKNLKFLEEKTTDSATQIYGVDISQKNIDNAKRFTHGKSILQVVDGVSVPFEDKFFDLSFTAEVLQHVPPKDFEKICNEFIRVTRQMIIHIEEPVNWDHRYAHNYEKFYKDKGYRVEVFKNPDISEYYRRYHVFLQ